MMITILLLLFFQDSGTLKIIVEGSENEGKIKFAIYNKDSEFLSDQAFRSGEGQISENESSCLIIIDQLPFGSYAISVFQDVNNDGYLNKNILGIPTEPYGFSNNARGKFGPPTFRDARFEFRASGKEIRIRLN